MDTKPRFTLSAILGCTAVLCVPLAMIAARQRLGFIFLFPVAGGCLGYLLTGKNGLMDGAIYGAVVMSLIVVRLLSGAWGQTDEPLESKSMANSEQIVVDRTN